MNDQPTPYLQFEAEKVRINLDRLARYAKACDLEIRPHTKTHKSIRLAKMQLGAGAAGLTVAKVGEAQTMAEAGDDLLLAYPSVGPWRCEQIAALAQGCTVRVAVDSALAIESLSAAASRNGSTIGVLVDMDVGMGRTGVQTPAAAVALAQKIELAAGLQMDGLFCYPGHIWDLPDDQGAVMAKVSSMLAEALAMFNQQGLAAPIVSGGSTPTAYQSHLVPQYTEVRPGTYIFNDMNTVRGGFCSLDDCAATIVATVVSNAVSGQVVIDAGSKTLTSDICIPAPDSGYGYLVEYPLARISILSEEHGQVDVRSCDRPPAIGERVTIIPNHICPCVNLQDQAWWNEPSQTSEPIRIDARGKVS